MSDFQQLLVPYDFSEHARAALDVACDLARRLDSKRLHLVHVLQTPIYAGGYGTAVPPMIDIAQLREPAERSLRETADEVAETAGLSGSVDAEVVEGTNVARSLHEVADKVGADLIVMGTHGRTGLAHVFLGSVAERTLRQAPCPVLTVQGEESDADA